MDRVEVIKEVYRRLKEIFPTPYRPDRTPVEQAVFTVLSQNTTDRYLCHSSVWNVPPEVERA